MTSTAPLPPGNPGLPLLGETLAFLKDPYAFVADRAREHGPIFRTRLLGNDTAVIVGPEAGGPFIDPKKVERAGSQPGPVYRLFAGPSLPHLDGTVHAERKSIVLQGFTREALASYVPSMDRSIVGAFERWTSAPEISWLPELKRLAMQTVSEDFLSISAPEELDRLISLYDVATRAFTAIPIPVPGTAYARGLRAVDEILDLFRTVVRDHRARPRDDGLSRILAFTTESGARLDDDGAIRELHHLLIAGRVVYAHLVSLVLHLTAAPDVRARLAEEARRVSGSPGLDDLDGLDYLHRVVLEVKRLSPVVPAMFARALDDLEIFGYRVPKGWSIMFGLHQTHLDGGVYRDPHRFDPDRFAEGRVEHERYPHGFVPHGPGAPRTSHHCAGTDYATLLVKVFALRLARDHDWQLPEQELGYDWSQLTPDPKEGLRATVRRA